MSIRILVYPLRAAIRHSAYQLPPGLLAKLLSFIVAGSLVEMDAFSAVRLSRGFEWDPSEHYCLDFVGGLAGRIYEHAAADSGHLADATMR